MVRRYWIATLVDTNDVARYARECACVLREIFGNAWLKTLCADFESNPTGPGSHAGEHYDSEKKFDDYCNWECFAEYRALVYGSPSNVITAAVMQSPSVV